MHKTHKNSFQVIWFTIIIGFVSNFQSYSQKKIFQVKDSLTNSNIEYVAVNLMNGYGVFSDKDGIVNLEINDVEEIEFSHISYKNKKINPKELNEIVYLSAKEYFLNEVVLLNNRKKKQYFKKTEKNKNDSQIHFGTYGYQLAMLIKIEGKENSFLEEINIPIQVDELWMRINKESFIPYSLIQISFHKNNNNTPCDNEVYEIETVFLDKIVFNNKTLNYKLKNKLNLSDKGVFCVLTFLGKSDKYANLINESPFFKSTLKDKEIILTKYYPVQIPIIETKSNSGLLSRNIFHKNSTFSKTHPIMTIPPNINEEEKSKLLNYKISQLPFYFVNIGLKYYSYED
jgi:hypothetical protein